MPPKQATIGKFFGNPNGTKSAPQQSKLSFGSKPASDKQAKNEAIKDEPSTADSDVQMKDEDPETTNGVSDEKDSPLPTRKRQVDEEGQSSEDSDDAPPTKRQRHQPALKNGKLGDSTSTSKGSKPKSEKKSRKKVTFREAEAEAEDEVEEEEVEAENVESAKPSRPSRSKSGSTKVEDEPTNQATVKTEPEDEGEQGSENEEAESEDEKPEVSTKAHEKIQSTLKAQTKDPYPDWKAGEPVPYAALCTTFSKIEMTTKRLEISAHCSLFLRQVLRLTPKDLLPTILLMINKLAADYAGIELGIGESLIMKAIGETTGRNLDIIKADQKEIGDLGLVAAKSRSTQPTMFKPKPLTVRGVHEGMMAIATVEGQGSQGRKVGGIKKLLSAADAQLAGKGSKGIDITKDKGGPSESKYIIRTLEGKMRLGLAEKTVIVALASAMVTHEIAGETGNIPGADKVAEGERVLKSVYSELPSYEVIIPAMLEHGIFNLKDSCKLQPGVPLKPMLARPTKSITEVLDRFEGHEFTCEYKYDGERAQIHFVAHDSDQQYATPVPQQGKSDKGISNIFSRNSEDLSKKYPDILARLPSWVKDGTKSFVLDCETVAWDVKEKKVMPFQQLMTRKRKDVKEEDIKVKVCVFAFDILFLNGEALVTKSFRERRDALHSAFNEVEGEFAFAKHGNTNELETIQTLLEDSVKASCEGLMVKMLDGTASFYEPSRRSQNWLKVKKDYLAGAGDSLDLAVLGAYHGKGKRTNWYGAFLLAAYDADKEVWESVCNIGTGFSEAMLDELHKQLEPIIIDKPKPFYHHSAGNKDQPDVWFEPKYVWEVKSADLTLSPRYQAAAAAMGGKGVSLRFPRFLRVRDDKKAEDATTTRQVAEMYRAQEGVAKKSEPSVDDDFEY